MKPDYFDIQLDRDDGRYYAGEVINGSIIVSLPTPIKVKKILVKLTGGAHTGWVNKTSDVIYESNEVLLDDYSDLTNYMCQYGDDEMLPAGVHTLPFKFTLPAGLPSSVFNEYVGWVRYTCSAVVEILPPEGCLIPIFSGGTEVSVDKPITVYSLLSLDDSRYRQPSSASEQEELVGCGCGAQGTITATVYLPEIGYMAGETVQAQIRIDTSNRKPYDKKVPVLALCQRMNFASQNRYQMELFDRKEMITCLETAAVPPGASVADHPPAFGEAVKRKLSKAERNNPNPVRQVSLVIPPGAAATSATGNWIISTSYFLKLDMHSFEVHMPIVVGTTGKQRNAAQ